MSKFSITNITNGGVTLPVPYEVILPPGKGIIVEGTEQEILTNLGGPSAILGVLRLELVASSNQVSPTWDGTAIGLAFVYRPGATGADAPGGNVYTDWATMMIAVDATKKLGMRSIEFDNTFAAPGIGGQPTCLIPAGIWNMTDVKWFAHPRDSETRVEMLDGCGIVIDTSIEFNEKGLFIEGFGLHIYYNGTWAGGVVPFDGINVLMSGNNVRFGNTNPLAKPIFRGIPGGWTYDTLILFSGQTVNGGTGSLDEGGFDIVAPIIDLNGGIMELFAGGGRFGNGFCTDLSVGGGGFLLGLVNDNVSGDHYSQWECPGLTGNGGSLFMGVIRNTSRYRVDPDFLLSGPVQSTDSPFPASYNGFVPVCTAGGAVTIEAPRAGNVSIDGSYGERFTVNDIFQSGIPDSFAVVDGVVTLTDATGKFSPWMVGQLIVIAGATSGGNNGSFILLTVNAAGTIVTYANASGVSEAGAGTWKVGGASVNNITVTSAYGDYIDDAVITTDGGSRTWVCWGAKRWSLVSKV